MRWFACAIAVVLAVAVPGLAAAEISPAEIERARARVLTDSFQRSLPQHAEALGQGGSADGMRERMSTRDRARRIDTREYQAQRTERPVSGLVTVLMWAFVVIGFALLAFWIAAELLKTSDDPRLPAEKRDDDALTAAAAAIIDKPLEDADELARREQYAEAIHALLLRTLHELARSAMVRVERSHTSREILARVPLLADAREALAGLITAVELTHFGDEPASAADYARCREQFNVFATAFRAGLSRAHPQAVAA